MEECSGSGLIRSSKTTFVHVCINNGINVGEGYMIPFYSYIYQETHFQPILLGLTMSNLYSRKALGTTNYVCLQLFNLILNKTLLT